MILTSRAPRDGRASGVEELHYEELHYVLLFNSKSHLCKTPSCLRLFKRHQENEGGDFSLMLYHKIIFHFEHPFVYKWVMVFTRYSIPYHLRIDAWYIYPSLP